MDVPTPRPPTPDEPRPTRLKAWQGTVALLVGGIGAQLAGGGVLILALVVLALVSGQPVEYLTHLQGEEDLLSNFAVVGPSILATGLCMIAVATVTPALARVRIAPALGLRRAPWPTFVAGPVGILALGPTSDGLRRLMERYLPNLTLGSLASLDAVARSAPLWAIIPAMALVPGISEELLFRGMFQRSIRRGWLAVTLSAVVFAAYHFDPHHVVAVLPLGFYLAWLVHRSGSVLVSMTAHAINNTAAVLTVRLLGAEDAEGFDLWYVPVGWVIAAASIGVVWWSTRPRDERREPRPPAPHESGPEPAS